MAIGPRQAKFIQEYIKLGNATKAAEIAGYKESNARREATRLLSKAHIRERVRDEMHAAGERALISVARVLREISFVAHCDVADVFDMSGDQWKLKRLRDIPLRARRAVASVKVKRTFKGSGDDAEEIEEVEIKFWDKMAALDKLCRHLAIYADQAELDKLRTVLEEIKARQKREEPSNGKLPH